MITLNKNPNKDFIILNLTDTHLTGDDWTVDTGHKKIVEKTVSELIDRVKPDLITLTGDYSTEPYFIDLVRFADYMESLGIPWAPIWGNHENVGSAEFLNNAADVFLTKPHCLFEKGDPAMGNGNYVITINENGVPVTALLMMDTHQRGYINDTQIAWYKQNIAALKKMGCSNSAIFCHHPLKEYTDAINAALVGGLAAADQVKLADSYGEDCWNEGYKESFGICHDPICPIENDSVWFETIRASESTKYYICGHEHINNFVVDYRGVRLVYALKTGLDGYSWTIYNGGTVLTVDKNGIADLRHEFVDVEGMPHYNP